MKTKPISSRGRFQRDFESFDKNKIEYLACRRLGIASPRLRQALRFGAIAAIICFVLPLFIAGNVIADNAATGRLQFKNESSKRIMVYVYRDGDRNAKSSSYRPIDSFGINPKEAKSATLNFGRCTTTKIREFAVRRPGADKIIAVGQATFIADRESEKCQAFVAFDFVYDFDNQTDYTGKLPFTRAYKTRTSRKGRTGTVIIEDRQ